MTATVVLVHGAFHGSGYWSGTLKGLADRGIAAVAPDLPGHGAHPGPLTDLHGDAAAVRAVLDGISGPVLLVGHSYGGAVVTEASEHPNVQHVLFLAAYCLAEGEHVNNAAPEADVEGFDHDELPGLAAAMHIDHLEGTATLDAVAARPVLYPDLNDEQFAEVSATLGPQRLGNFQEEPAAHGWIERASTYVVCSQDRTIHPHLQRVMARRTMRAAAWDTGHFPMITMTDKTVAMLAKIAERY
jgi:pimeloyl-ACP methyl ester carboxylesterase